MKALSPQDAGFLYLERSNQPMHVGGLHLYSLPADAGEGYIAELIESWRRGPFEPPFNQKLVWPLRRLGQPAWVRDAEIDAEYHLRHSALPSPGRYREMFALVSRLHGTLLHRDRPLWEAHLIEGVESNQFALYTKMHHAMIDGMGGMRLLQRALSTDPDRRDMVPPWALGRRKRGAGSAGNALSLGGLRSIAEQVGETVGAVPGAVKGMLAYADAMRHANDDGLASPFRVPRTPLNSRIGAARRFVAQSWKIERIRAAGKALDATLNDMVLAMSAGALRRWLMAHAELPRTPLSAMAPVALTPKDADDYGNAVSAILCSLATNIEEPVARLQAIQRSMNQGKALLQSLSRAEIMLLTTLGAVPTALPLVLGLGHRLPPFNVVISNVPGPRERLYWNGARLDGMYPVSIPANGVALNITVTSYVDSLDFGLIACRRSVPSAQRLIDYLEEALAELEQAAGIPTPTQAAAGPVPQATARKPTAAAAKARPATKKSPAKAGGSAAATSKAGTGRGGGASGRAAAGKSSGAKAKSAGGAGRAKAATTRRRKAPAKS